MIDFFFSNWQDILLYIGEHIFISLISLGLGVVVAVPLGILVSKNKKLSHLVISIASILQTIPSLALLAMFVPLLGIGTVPAVAALFVYSLLPIIRNTVLGMEGVNKNTLDAAKGMGLTYHQLISKVQLPLALPVVMAGIRLSGVYVFAWASLAAYIGAGGLGNYIFNGLNTFNFPMILWGTIPVTCLALLYDYLMSRLEIRWSPKMSRKQVSE